MSGPETPKEAPKQAPESMPSSEEEVQKIESGLKDADPGIAKKELREQIIRQRVQAERTYNISYSTRAPREEQVANAGKVIDLIQQELDVLEGMEGQFGGGIAGVRAQLLSRWGYLTKIYPELGESKPTPAPAAPKKPQPRPAAVQPAPQKALPAEPAARDAVPGGPEKRIAIRDGAMGIKVEMGPEDPRNGKSIVHINKHPVLLEGGGGYLSFPIDTRAVILQAQNKENIQLTVQSADGSFRVFHLTYNRYRDLYTYAEWAKASEEPQKKPPEVPAKQAPQQVPPTSPVAEPTPQEEASPLRMTRPVQREERPAEDSLAEKQQSRRQLEQQRVEAERKYSTSPTEENAKAFIGAIESELEVLDRLPPVRRQTDAGEQFVLSDRILSKRAQVLMSHPSLQEPNMQSPAVERVIKKRFAHERRGGVSLELLHGAEDALRAMGISINENGELYSKSERKVLVGGKNVEKIVAHEISRYTEGKSSVTLAVHFSEPFAARDFWSGELKRYNSQNNVETVVLTNGEVADRFANAKENSYENPGMINDEQCAKLSQKAAIAEKIWESTAAVFRRYERIPAKELTEQQATEMVQAKDRSEQMEREFMQRMEGSKKWDTGRWNWGVPNTDFQDRYVQAKLRLEDIRFARSEYSELFEDAADYGRLPIDGELKQLIREAKQKGYTFTTDHARRMGFLVLENGREIAHISQHFPDAHGRLPADSSDEALIKRLKEFIRNELSLRR